MSYNSIHRLLATYRMQLAVHGRLPQTMLQWNSPSSWIKKLLGLAIDGDDYAAVETVL